uniref:Odorant receptor n=3 Tax=Meteorus pulchricornis TaxID=51522 RepID=A0A1S5VFP1_9HYME|nr:olfactory receptor 40 [Meteorus pulchricornis]
MSVLPATFRLLQLTGVWLPTHWHSSILRSLYQLFSIVVLFLIYCYVICGLVELAIDPAEMLNTTNDLLILISMITNCGKSVNVLICREKIIEILDILQRDPCQPRDEKEIAIQNEWNGIIWSSTFTYGMLLETTGVLGIIRIMALNLPMGMLPFKEWLPYDYSNGFAYWQAYSQELIALFISTNLCIAYDTLVRGLIMQVTSKLYIFQHRLVTLPETLQSMWNNNEEKLEMKKLQMEKKLIADCVHFHLIILKLANTVHTTFNLVVCLQYCLSGIIICFNVYNIAHVNLMSSGSAEIILFLCSMLYQIYMICQAGDEITLVSGSVSEAIYNMDWTTLNHSTVESLIIMMNRTLRPIVFTSGSLITLSRNSFMKVIKLSYSMYNVLQDTSS